MYGIVKRHEAMRLDIHAKFNLIIIYGMIILLHHIMTCRTKIAKWSKLLIQQINEFENLIRTRN